MDAQLYTRYQSLLTDFLTFRSISTDPLYQKELTQTAQWLYDLFTSEGFDSKIVTGYDNPIVVARLTIDQTLPTMLIYGHYDVQPADKSEGWTCDPFQLHSNQDRLIGRGVVDNKGQVMIHIANVLELHKNDALRYNVIFFIEGNEETGSPHLSTFVEDYKEELKADYILISDGEILEDLPVIEVSLRGVVNAAITLRTLKNDLHSGLYGGAAPNAAHEAAHLVSKLVDTENANTVLIPGFYDSMKPPSDAELQNNAAIPFSDDIHTSITGSKYPFNGSKYDIYTQTGLLPSLEVTGIHAGYTEVGYRNSIPSTAIIKLNIRLVAGQEPLKIQDLLERYLFKVMPKHVTYEIDFDESCAAVKIDTSDHIFSTIRDALTDIWGCTPVNKHVGGSIPIVTTFQEILGVPIIMLPLGNEDCNMHGVDENFKLEYIHKGLQVSRKVLGGNRK